MGKGVEIIQPKSTRLGIASGRFFDRAGGEGWIY